MADLRKQEREKVEQGKATIEEMTYKNFDDMQFGWCVESRIAAGDSEEAAKSYCNGNREEVRRIIATDQEEKAKLEADQKAKAETVIADVNSSIQSHVEEVMDAGLLESCVKVRMDSFKEDSVRAHAFCKEILSDPLFCHLWQKQLDAEKNLEAKKLREEESREAWIRSDAAIKYKREFSTVYSECLEAATREYEQTQTRPDADTFEEYGERVYIVQKLYGVSEEQAKRYVTSDMVREGKFADVTKPIYSHVSVGDLFGKITAQIVKDDAAQAPNTRTSVGNLYGKSRKEIGDMSKSEETFRQFENQQRKRGVTMPSNKQEFPAPGRTTVGSTYGKTRKQILEEQKQQEEEERK